jgi:hypothetical protein
MTTGGNVELVTTVEEIVVQLVNVGVTVRVALMLETRVVVIFSKVCADADDRNRAITIAKGILKENMIEG